MTFRTLLFPCLVALSGLFAACEQDNETVETSQTPQTMAEAADPGMTHTVYFWLQDSLTQADKDSFVEGVKSLESAPSVRRLFMGTPAGTPSRGVVNNSFDYSLVLWFDDVAGHDAYQVSDIHLKFVADHEAKFKEVRVHDHENL